MPKIKSRSSRRVPGLKDDDYDHEITLVDHSASDATPRALSPASGEGRPATPPSPLPGPSTSRRTPPQSPRRSVDRSSSRSSKSSKSSRGRSSSIKKGPSVQVEEPTPLDRQPVVLRSNSQKKPSSPESAIDILYENERGGFLCGLPLFSSKALGNLDPPPWTNASHKPSPTDINTAQVPDPSWEWSWPEWRVNHDEGVDDNGWEYSFMFAKKFSWHGPRWWNSFVRRRAWIRKRRKRDSVKLTDPHLLNTEYFSVKPASQLDRSPSRTSRASSRVTGKASMSQASRISTEIEIAKMDIEDIDMLMEILRLSRIDREKIEAVDSYLKHATDDLAQLEKEMHEIMAIFVFQASRRVLLTKLTEAYDQTAKEQKEHDTPELRRRAESLRAAIKHGDEEVRRLEYWSDVKGMVTSGQSRTAINEDKGWDGSWQGLDNSGPAEPDTTPSKE